jgi:hypothetical protein
LAVISTGRRNTLAKTPEDGVYAEDVGDLKRFCSGREGGVVGPLEASRGAELGWARV